MKLSSTLINNIGAVHGDSGRRWLSSLPALLAELRNAWELGPLTPFENLTYSWVARTRLRHVDAVLKVTPPCDRATREIAWYQHQPAVSPRLLRSDTQKGALLITRLRPGTPMQAWVHQQRDDEATEGIARVIMGLSESPIRDASGFRHVSQFRTDLQRLGGAVPRALSEKALALLTELATPSSEDCLLHGDLHHGNVLRSGQTEKAIDPHGYVGPVAFEVGAMMRNPDDGFPRERTLSETLRRRLSVLTNALPFSRFEVSAWSFLCTLISASWAFTDHGELPKRHLEIATQLSNHL